MFKIKYQIGKINYYYYNFFHSWFLAIRWIKNALKQPYPTQKEFFLVYNHFLTNHFNQPLFLVYIWIRLFSSLLFFQQAGSMPGGALWTGSEWNHVWVSPQLLKNSFTTSGQQDSNPLPSIFDSQHLSFGLNHTDSHQIWLVKMAGYGVIHIQRPASGPENDFRPKIVRYFSGRIGSD
jgi:hypothetical protein